MKGRQDTPRDNFTPALEAIGNLLRRELNEIFFDGQMAAQNAHTEIELAPINRKGGVFWRHYLPSREKVVSLLASSYRRYIKLALAHPHQGGPYPAQWACDQVQPAVGAALEWIRDWYILACDGENQYVQRIAGTEFVPGTTVSIPLSIPVPPAPESWRAPAWLFQVSLALVGVGPLKSEHVPPADSEQKLGAAHTRLLLKGAKRVFVWELQAALERVRDEEIADAGAIPAETTNGQPGGSNEVPKHWMKGTEGLVRKTDLSQYMHNMTEKQQLAFSLKYEYELGLTEIASRMGLDRKTAYEHIQAANRKIDWDRSAERRKANRAKDTPDE